MNAATSVTLVAAAIAFRAASPDAVRFSVTEDAGPAVAGLRGRERSRPSEFGTLEYAVDDARLDGPPSATFWFSRRGRSWKLPQ